MPDIFDEVNEDLRAERMRRLVARYGGLLVGVALLAVLAVAGHQAWRWWQAQQAEKAADAYLAAASFAAAPGTDAATAAGRFTTLAKDAPAGYRVLARLRAAALSAEAGDGEAALAIWDSLARDQSIDRMYRDLATLLWGLHALGAKAGEVEARLAPLTGPDTAWRYSAREVQALAALQRGESDSARQTLAALAVDPSAPESVRQRAGRLLAGLGG